MRKCGRLEGWKVVRLEGCEVCVVHVWNSLSSSQAQDRKEFEVFEVLLNYTRVVNNMKL